MPEENNHITLDLDQVQKGRIKVHTQIINDLSSGIYSSPASCIKELVNNSYDADAKLVTIRVKPVHDNITIIDNGVGMNAVDFDQKFAWISHSTKRSDSEQSKELGRPLIGKIGIGFIAVNEICNRLEITSSKKGEKFKFTAKIDFKKYFEEVAVQEEGNSEKGIIKGEYELINEYEEADEHYTIIRLLGLKKSVKNILDGKQYIDEVLKKKNKAYKIDFFKSMKDLMEFHSKNELRSFSEDNAYVQFIIDLASFIPVEYIEKGPIEEVNDDIIQGLVKLHKELDFKVDLDGMYLKKPIYFPKKSYSQDYVSFDEKIEVVSNTEGENNIEEIKIKGYFYIQHKMLYPREINGVAIRIKNIPIADQFGFDDTFMKYPNYMNNVFRNWISGEIYVEKGLEEAMNIDRKSFRVTHPHYLALQNFVHRFLNDKIFKITLDMYEGRRDKKDEQRSKKKKEEGKRILNTSRITYKPSTNKTNQKTQSDKKAQLTSKQQIEVAPIKIVKTSSKSTTVEINQRIVKQFKKKDWEYLESVFLIFESAFQEAKGDIVKMRKLFYKKINEWKDIE